MWRRSETTTTYQTIKLKWVRIRESDTIKPINPTTIEPNQQIIWQLNK